MAMKKIMFVFMLVIFPVLLPGAPVPVNFNQAWMLGTETGIVTAMDEMEKRRKQDADFNMFYDFAFNPSGTLFSNLSGPQSAGMSYYPLRQKNLELGIYAVSSEIYAGKMYGFEFSKFCMAAGLSLATGETSAMIGAVLGDNTPALSARLGIGKLTAETIIGGDFITRYAAAHAGFKLPYPFTLKLNAEYYSYLDSIKAGLDTGLELPEGFLLSAGAMADVLNRGLGFGMSDAYLELRTPFIQDMMAMNIRGTYSEALFYGGIWGGSASLSFFNGFEAGVSYNDSHKMKMNCVKDALSVNCTLSLSLVKPEPMQEPVSTDSSLISDNQSGQNYQVDSFLYAKSMQDKGYFKRENREKAAVLSCLLTGAVSGSAVYFSGIDNNDRAAVPSAIAGAMLAYWVTPWVFDFFNSK